LPKRSDTPLEERDYGLIYFILSGLLAISTFWAIWDMIHERSPWQRYQMELNALEESKVRIDLGAAEADFEVKQAALYESFEQQLKEAQVNLQGEAYQQVQAELKDAQNEIADAMQNYRFAKSEYDAVWYEYKHAEHEGHDDEAKKNPACFG